MPEDSQGLWAVLSSPVYCLVHCNHLGYTLDCTCVHSPFDPALNPQSSVALEGLPHYFSTQGSLSCIAWYPIPEHQCFIHFVCFTSCFGRRINPFLVTPFWKEVEILHLILSLNGNWINMVNINLFSWRMGLLLYMCFMLLLVNCFN